MAQHKKYAAVDELVSVVTDQEALILDLGAGTGIIGQYVSSKSITILAMLQ